MSFSRLQPRIPIQIDIAFGDVITPGPVDIDYPALLDFPAPDLRAHPVETVVAEKFNAIVQLGIANSRLKDFYDLWFISRTFELQGTALSTAVARTFERRQTPMPTDVPTALTRLYAEEWDARWKALLNRKHMSGAPSDLERVLQGPAPISGTPDGPFRFRIILAPRRSLDQSEVTLLAFPRSPAAGPSRSKTGSAGSDQ